MRAIKWSLIVMGLLALPSYAGGQTLPTTPPSGYFNAVAANPKGTVTNITYGSNYVARVYTPPGYSRSQAYPYMFLMHGLGGSEASWHDNDLYAHIQLDNLIAQGAVDPFIIVFTRNDYDNWNFGPILINTLIPYIEANFCVSTHPDNRALGGLSMGGMQTINIGFPNADKFHYLMPSSPAPGIAGQSTLFPNGGALAMANLKLIFFSCGSGEVGAYGCNNVNTVKGYAQSNGLGSIIKDMIVQGGAHDRNTWRPSFWNFAQLADQAGFTQVGTARSSGCMGGGTGGTSGGTGGASGGTAGAGGGSGGGRGGTSGLAGRGGGGGTTGGSAGGRGGSGGAVGGRGGQAGGSAGAGGTTASGSGGGIPSGSGGSAAGTGGMSATGSGGSGAGGTIIIGTGGSPVGTGGTSATGSGGAPAGTGGVIGSGGTGGSGAPTGTGGGGASPGETDSAGCACALAPGGARAAPSETASVLFAVLLTVAAAVLCRARRGRRRSLRG
jgi:putative esterase